MAIQYDPTMSHPKPGLPAERVLLRSAQAGGAGDPVDVQDLEDGALMVASTSTTSGTDFDLEAELPDGTWVQIATVSITADGNVKSDMSLAPYRRVRGRLRNYQDGSHTGWVAGL